jgi:hypothetical protein
MFYEVKTDLKNEEISYDNQFVFIFLKTISL